MKQEWGIAIGVISDYLYNFLYIQESLLTIHFNSKKNYPYVRGQRNQTHASHTLTQQAAHKLRPV